MTTIPTIDGKHAGIELLALLSTPESAPATLEAEDIHRIRVAIKQTRAWLKLVCGVSGKTIVYRQLQDNLRELSNSLSGQRDRDVALHTLAKLARKYPGKKAQQLIDVLSQQLAQRRLVSYEMSALRLITEQIRHELLPLTQQVVPRETLTAVVRRSYTKMCKTGETALASQSCADLHAWRKRVKTLGYQLAMVPISAPHWKKTIQRLTKLGSKLGNVHDLCFLQVMIGEILAQTKIDLDLAPLLKRIERERNTLIESVSKLHQHVCESPPQLTVC